MVKNKGFRGFFRSALLLVGLAIIGHMGYRNEGLIVDVVKNSNVLLLVVATLVAVAGNFLICQVFGGLLEKYHSSITGITLIKIYFYSQLAKYIPGKIWTVVLQKNIMRSTYDIRPLLLVNIDFTALIVLLSVNISVSILVFLEYDSLTMAAIICGSLLVAGNALFRSCIVNKMFCRLCCIFNLKVPDNKCSIEKGHNFFFINYILFMVSYLISQLLIIHAIFDIQYVESLAIVSLLTIGLVVGAVTLLVPGGIGVKELVFYFLASKYIPSLESEVLIAISIVIRMALIAQELIGAMAAMVMSRFNLLRLF